MAESTKGYGQLGPSINWGGLFAGLSNDITKNQQLQLQAKRKKQLKMEEDQIASVKEAAEFGKLEYTPDNYTGPNSFQDIIQGATNQIKNNYLDISKNPNLSNLQKSIYKQNTATDMLELANISKSFNEVIQQMTMPQLQNSYVNSLIIDLNKDLKQVSSGWGYEDLVNPITGVKTRSFKNNPDFAFAVSTHITEMLDPSNPRDAWSVIADNGYTKVNDLGYPQKYELYSTASEKNNILDKKLAEFRIGMGLDKMVPDLDKNKKQQKNKDGTVKMKTEPGRDITEKEADDFLNETEGYLVATGTDSLGMPIPLLTEQFFDDAGDFITKTIDTQLGSTISSAPGKKTNSGSGDTPKTKAVSGEYKILKEAIDKKDWTSLNSIMKPGLDARVINGKVVIYSEEQAKANKFRTNDPATAGVVAYIKNPSNMNSWARYTTIDVNEIEINKNKTQGTSR